MKSMERTPIKGRLFLVLHDRDGADQLARDLDAKGWSCAVSTAERDHGISRIREAKPVAVIIDASRATDIGISTAAAMRANAATRAIPIIFIHASKAVDRISAAVSDPIFASPDALGYALDELAGR